MSKFEKIIKTFLVVFNATMMMAGICIIVLSGWILLGKAYLGELIGQHIYIGILYLFLATASFVVIISILGCCGAANEIRWMLYLYGAILLVIFVVIMSTCITTLISRERATKLIKNSMKKTVKSYSKNEAIAQSWDYIQLHLKCCGIDSYEDWNGSIPLSCCKYVPPDGDPDCDVNIPEAVHIIGCYDIISEYLSSHMMCICIIGLTIGLLKIIGMGFAFALARILIQRKMRVYPQF